LIDSLALRVKITSLREPALMKACTRSRAAD
jgi:hypothetical protein